MTTSRRDFIRFATAGAVVGTAGAQALLAACAPNAPARPADGSTSTAAAGAPAPGGAKPGAGPYPTYIPVANAP